VLFSRAFPKPEGVGDEDAWRACIECSRYMARKAADSGVKFAFETDHFNFIDTLEGTQRLLAEVGPDMWINFDPCNFYFGGAKPMEVIEALYDRFVHGHVKDCFDTPEGPKEAPVGQGVIPYDTIFAELKKRGWNGAMCIEHCKDKECVAAAWKHVQAMRKIAGV